jgi:lipoyl(octanoyl) transferase
MISVFQLEQVDYVTGLLLQQRLVELRKAGLIGDVLLLLEHSPVITLGRNAKRENVIASPEELSRRGVESFECDRGGDVTFHGPGQLVGYPIFDLRSFPSSEPKRNHLGVVEYVRRLEEVLIRTCADFGIASKRIPGLTGVWTDPETEAGSSAIGSSSGRSSMEAKIAALGVHISRGVTSHGFALNVNTDLSYFNLIIPCGIASKAVTSMQRELGRAISLQDVAHSVSRNFGTVFTSQVLWLENLEALLGTTVGVPVRLPKELRDLHRVEDQFWG